MNNGNTNNPELHDNQEDLAEIVEPSEPEETVNQKIGSFIAVFTILIPGIIVSDFMPEFNVLPFGLWLTIAAVGGGISGAVYTKRLVLGSVSGLVLGAGALLGVYNYVDIRSLIIDSQTYFTLELIVGAAIGAIPGFIIYLIGEKILSESNDSAIVINNNSRSGSN